MLGEDREPPYGGVAGDSPQFEGFLARGEKPRASTWWKRDCPSRQTVARFFYRPAKMGVGVYTVGFITSMGTVPCERTATISASRARSFSFTVEFQSHQGVDGILETPPTRPRYKTRSEGGDPRERVDVRRVCRDISAARLSCSFLADIKDRST